METCDGETGGAVNWRFATAQAQASRSSQPSMRGTPLCVRHTPRALLSARATLWDVIYAQPLTVVIASDNEWIWCLRGAPVAVWRGPKAGQRTSPRAGGEAGVDLRCWPGGCSASPTVDPNIDLITQPSLFSGVG